MDISSKFIPNNTDSRIANHLLRFEFTDKAIQEFVACSQELSDYAYWFLLRSLWISFVGTVDLSLWKSLFYSSRPMGKLGRNNLCPCGSGKKFKKCCLEKGKTLFDVSCCNVK